MNLKNCFKNFTTSALLLFLSVGISSAQANKLSAPRQEKLLNGLKVLTFSEPNAEKVTVKLRIHSGSAFDRQDREGTMALLSDILFPNEEAIDFFREDLNGSLEVESNFDYIEITATANAAQYLTMLETVANAVSKPQIDKEITAKIVSVRLGKINEMEKNPSYIADLAAAEKLYGAFPYGRAQMGTSASLPKIDFAELIFARDRFLTPDNATLAFSGNIKPELVNRAVRRYFGAWEKSDQKIPATFAQPEPIKADLPVKVVPVENVSEYRIAFRNVARSNKDFYTSNILAKILQNRAQAAGGSEVSVLQHAQLLNGSVIMSFPKWNLGQIKRDGDQISLPETDSILKDLLEKPVSETEFAAASTKVTPPTTADLLDLWLDADTYKLSSVKEDMKNAQSVTLADVNKLAERLEKNSVRASSGFRRFQKRLNNKIWQTKEQPTN